MYGRVNSPLVTMDSWRKVSTAQIPLLFMLIFAACLTQVSQLGGVRDAIIMRAQRMASKHVEPTESYYDSHFSLPVVQSPTTYISTNRATTA